MKRTGIKILLAAAIIVMTASVFTACNKENSSATVAVGTTAVIERAVRGEYNYDMLAAGCSDMPLIYQDAEGNYHGLLADFSTEDSKTWTYAVKDGFKWSDGEDVTAEDILYTLQYNDAHGEAVFSEKTDSNGNVTKKKYEAYALSADGMSLSLTLATASVRALADMTTFRTMPKHVYEGKDSVSDGDARVTCGPYVLKEFNKNAASLTFEVNPYYPKTPNVKKIIFKTYLNPDTMYLALKHGDIDAVWAYSQGVPKTYAETLDGVRTVSITARNLPAVMMFNNSVAPFDDVNVRNAVSYAIDYEHFKNAFGGEEASVPSRGVVPKSTLGYKETETASKNFEKAAELLRKSGYVKADSEKYFKKGNAPLEFTLTYRSSSATHVRYAELVKINLEEFGIKVNLDPSDAATFNLKTSNKYAGENNTAVSHQAAINGFTAAGMGMGDGLGSIYVNKNHLVQGGCQVDDEEFLNILSEMSASKTLNDYISAAGKLQEYYAANTPLIALFWDNVTYAYSKRLNNVTVDAVFGINNVINWTSMKV